jgi:hypothetical protein
MASSGRKLPRAAKQKAHASLFTLSTPPRASKRQKKSHDEKQPVAAAAATEPIAAAAAAASAASSAPPAQPPSTSCCICKRDESKFEGVFLQTLCSSRHIICKSCHSHLSIVLADAPSLPCVCGETMPRHNKPTLHEVELRALYKTREFTIKVDKREWVTDICAKILGSIHAPPHPSDDADVVINGHTVAGIGSRLSDYWQAPTADRPYNTIEFIDPPPVVTPAGFEAPLLAMSPTEFESLMLYIALPGHQRKKIVQVLKTDKVLQLKKKIERSDGIPAEHQRLICDGKQLEDDHTFESYGIQSGSRVMLSVTLRGS